MERTKTFVNGGRLYPADINSIEDRAAEMLEGTAAAIPSSHYAGRYYRATDTGDLYLDNGTTWKKIAGKEAVEGINLGSSTIRQETGTKQSFLSWGYIAESGAIEVSSEDFTVSKVGTGEYTVTFNKEKTNAKYAIIGMGLKENIMTSSVAVDQTAKSFRLLLSNVETKANTNAPFSFTVLATN